MLCVIRSAPAWLSFQMLSRKSCSFARCQRIECAQRFVQQKETRIGSQCPRDPDSLAHASGQFPDLAVPSIGQADAVQQVVCNLAPFLLSDTLQGQGEGHVVAGVQPRIERIVLENDSAFGAGPVIGCPSTRTAPDVGRWKPAARLRRLVLPEPERPMMTTNSPLDTERLIRSSTRSS